SAQPDPGPAEPRQLDDEPVAIDRDHGRGVDDRERNAETGRAPANDRERIPDGPGDRDVAALDDRGLLAGDVDDRRAEPVRVVEVDVRDRRDAAVPGMGRIEPSAEADLDEREVDALLGEPAEDDGGQKLELGRVAETPRDPVRGR